MEQDVNHLVALALVNLGLSGLLQQAKAGVPFDTPDAVSVTMDDEGNGDVTYSRGGFPVSGESL